VLRSARTAVACAGGTHPRALGQDDEPRVQFGVSAESDEVGVVVGGEHELLADSESQQLVISHPERSAVARAGRLVAVRVRAVDECRGQALVDPEPHALWVARRLRTG